MVDLTDNSALSCSFCGKPQKEVNKLVSGPSVYICEECVVLCSDIIEEAAEKNKLEDKTQTSKLKKPSEIKKILDSYVIGQDRAKKTLSVAVYNHYKRIDDKIDASDVELQKSNILLLGPTGTGKTLLAQTLAKIIDVPFCVADATGLTEAGYVGEDVESIVGNLLTAADGDIKRAERGIVYVDEIDKVTRKGESTSITRDVSGEGVQQALLKMIEGTKCNVPPRGGRKHPNQDFLQIDTSQILFICGGAFSGLEKLIEQRAYKKAIGFGSEVKKEAKDKNNILQFVEPQDLTKFGLIPEFIGRLPVVSALESLDKESLVKILTEPQNALIKQYECLLEMDGVKLSFTDKALDVIAEEALKNKTGARGLRTILESAMLDIMFDMPSTKGVSEIVLNERSVLKREKPLIVMDPKSLENEPDKKKPRNKKQKLKVA